MIEAQDSMTLDGRNRTFNQTVFSEGLQAFSDHIYCKILYLSITLGLRPSIPWSGCRRSKSQADNRAHRIRTCTHSNKPAHRFWVDFFLENGRLAGNVFFE